MNSTDSYHTPVLLDECLVGLGVEKGKRFIDGTLGGGGHSLAMVECGGIVLGIDQDTDAIEHVKSRVRDSQTVKIGVNLCIRQGNFRDIAILAKDAGFTDVDGILFDLGMSTHQIEGSGRGFSYTRTEPLDMRMSVDTPVSAAQIINSYSREQLYEIFAKYAEEIHSRSIASAIIRARALKRIEFSAQLAECIETELRRQYTGMPENVFEKKSTQTIARIFQALRIVVNDEIGALKKALGDSVSLLKPGGRIAIISYHSLEDREVKLHFRLMHQRNIIKNVTKHPIVAADQEIKTNRKARSAKLRIFEKI